MYVYNCIEVHMYVYVARRGGFRGRGMGATAPQNFEKITILMDFGENSPPPGYPTPQFFWKLFIFAQILRHFGNCSYLHKLLNF